MSNDDGFSVFRRVAGEKIAELMDRAERAEAKLTREREKVQMLRDALRSLHDEQNDAPLERRRDHWRMAMNDAISALAITEDTP